MCLLVAVIPATASGQLQAVVIDAANPGGSPLEVWTQAAPVPEHIRIELDVGDGVEGRVLRVRPVPGKHASYRVQVQFETSAAISGEGPHIDLLDWKHCRSQWRSAQSEGRDGFRLPTPVDRDHSCFPNASREELRAALEQQLGKYGFDPASQQWWLEAADRVPRVGEFPSYVAISTVRVRIEQYDGRQWRVLTTIDFGVPMGC
jgi:hypothetical protein